MYANWHLFKLIFSFFSVKKLDCCVSVILLLIIEFIFRASPFCQSDSPWSWRKSFIVRRGSWRGHFLWLSSCMSFTRHHKARLPELSSSPYQLRWSSPYPSLRFSENKEPRRRILLHLTCLGHRRSASAYWITKAHKNETKSLAIITTERSSSATNYDSRNVSFYRLDIILFISHDFRRS